MKWIEETHVELKDVREPKIIEASIVSAKCSSCENYSEEVNQFPPYMHYKFCPHCGEKVEVQKCNPEIASETEETNLDDYMKELQDKIYHCLHIPTSVKDGITATEIQKQKEHDFLKYVMSKTMDYEEFILENHERNKFVSTTSEALEMIKFASYLMVRCKEAIDNLDNKHPHYEELYSIYSLMQDSISKMGEKSYFLIELYKKFKAFNSDNSSKE